MELQGNMWKQPGRSGWAARRLRGAASAWLILLVLLTTAPRGVAHAQESLASSFDPQTGFIEPIKAMALQADGRIVIGGSFQTGEHLGLARINPDGTLDETFQATADGTVHVLAAQPDGRIIVGGGFQHVSGRRIPGLARLNADGTLDEGFAPQVGGTVVAVVVQPDGKLLIGGIFWQVGGENRSHIARLNADGSLDTSFNPGPGADSFVYALALDEAGRVLIGGNFTGVGGYPRSYLARLGPEGALDQTFNPGANGPVRSLAVQPDGNILVGGEFNLLAGAERDSVGRLTPDGALDASLGYQQLDGPVYSLALQADGAILIGGAFTYHDQRRRPAVARLLPNGTPDIGFSPYPNSAIDELALQPDGKLLIAGDFTQVNGQTRNRLARINPDGTLDGALIIDPNFRVQLEGQLYTAEVQPDGKLVVGGLFTRVDGQERSALARLNADGSLDGTFNVRLSNPGRFDYLRVIDILVQPDGKLLIAGSFTYVEAGGEQRQISELVRLNPDGTIDGSFNPRVEGTIYALLVQPDGKIVIGGEVRSVDQKQRLGLARLNPDGTLDPFFAATMFDGRVNSLTRLPDGKIMVGGHFVTVNGDQRPALARLDADGAFDPSFDAQMAPYGEQAAIWTVAVQPDGRLLIGGFFAMVGGVYHPHMARVHADGSYDKTFTMRGIGGVNAILLRDDGSALAIDGSRILVARPDGTRDPNFLVQMSNGGARVIAVQPDGNMVVVGNFTAINGLPHAKAARLFGIGPLP